MTHSFSHAVIGGTFDHLHSGHKHFIASVLSQTNHLTIGLSQSPLYLGKPYANTIESYSTRKTRLQSFLKDLGATHATSITPLSDTYGPAVTNTEFEAIFVTTANHSVANTINNLRQNNGLTPLTIVTIPYLYGDDNQVISSTRIRAGEINAQGSSYAKFMSLKEIYHLPASLRSSLQTPLGTTIKDLGIIPSLIKQNSYIIAVGDIVSVSLRENGYFPAVSIIDRHTRRKKIESRITNKYFAHPNYTIKNLAGTINHDFATVFLASIKEYSQTQAPQVIEVSGEEDLLALPTILLAPLGSYLVYGQYNLGMCIVKITAETKSLAKKLLTEFD